MNIILASQSPRRLFLLKSAGFSVDVRPSDIDEAPQPSESVQDLTLRLCREKARACVLNDNEFDMPVVAADTLVAIGDDILGQPMSVEEARRMIQQLSGNQHQVHTTVCVRCNEQYLMKTVTTQVNFREITNDEIDIYVKHNDIMDKAGAYAIQGGASGFIMSIQGSLDNVIGLPVLETIGMLRQVQAKQKEG